MASVFQGFDCGYNNRQRFGGIIYCLPNRRIITTMKTKRKIKTNVVSCWPIARPTAKRLITAITRQLKKRRKT